MNYQISELSLMSQDGSLGGLTPGRPRKISNLELIEVFETEDFLRKVKLLLK